MVEVRVTCCHTEFLAPVSKPRSSLGCSISTTLWGRSSSWSMTSIPYHSLSRQGGITADPPLECILSRQEQRTIVDSTFLPGSLLGCVLCTACFFNRAVAGRGPRLRDPSEGVAGKGARPIPWSIVLEVLYFLAYQNETMFEGGKWKQPISPYWWLGPADLDIQMTVFRG